MLIALTRTILLYSSVVIAMRVMGKREIGQLQPYELVVAILLAELAAIPMESPGIPLIYGLTPIMTILFAQVILSYISLKSIRARSIICGTPSVLIENGKIQEAELRKTRYNLSDLIEQLRQKNVPNISDVEFAILETSGKLSVIPKSQKRPATPEDLNLQTKYEGLPQILIADGHVMHNNLKKINLDLKWLQTQLNQFNIRDPKQVLFASIDTDGKLFYQQRGVRL